MCAIEIVCVCVRVSVGERGAHVLAAVGVALLQFHNVVVRLVHLLRVWGLGFGVWGLGLGVWGLGSRVESLGLRVSGFGFRVSGFGFRVSGFGVRVSGFGFRDSGFGVRVSGLGFEVDHGVVRRKEVRKLPREQPLYRNVQWFRGGLVFDAHRLLYHSA